MIQNLFSSGVVQEFRKNEVIVNAYEKPAGVYLIEKGFVKSYSVSDQGDENIQLVRSKGDIFPLLWALGKIKRDVFFAAMDNVRVRRISAADFNNQIESSHELLTEMNQRLVEIYMLMAERIRNLEQRRAKDRLVYCLTTLASRFGKKDGNKVIITTPIHHHDIADMINTSRETTSREFAALEKAGKVGYKDHKVYIVLD